MLYLNQKRVLQAIDFMMTLHKEQKRKGRDVPYITHLFSVASKVLECGGNEEQFISALLHDSVEDQSKSTNETIANRFVSMYSEEEGNIESYLSLCSKDEEANKEALVLLRMIAKMFGEKVAYYVAQCSDSFTYPKKPWEERKREFITRCYLMPPDVKIIVACDKWHNLYSIYHDYCGDGDIIWLQFNGNKEGSLWYYREIIQALKKDWSHPILSELDFYFSCLLEKTK